MSIQSFSGDVLGSITAHCDAKTLYTFRGTCQAANAIGKDCMSEEVATRVIFHHPEQYRTLRLNALKESRKVAINALINLPELMLEPSFPEQFRTDKEMVKTAFVAAKMLKKEEVASAIRAMASPYESDLQVLDQHIDETQLPGTIHPDLLQYAPFFVHASGSLLNGLPTSFRIMRLSGSREYPIPLDDAIPNDIKNNIDIVSNVLKKTWAYDDIFCAFRDTEEVARTVRQSQQRDIDEWKEGIQYEPAFVTHLRRLKDARVFQVASDCIRRSVRSSCLAISKNLRNIKCVCLSFAAILQKIALCASIVFAGATRPFVLVYDRMVRNK